MKASRRALVAATAVAAFALVAPVSRAASPTTISTLAGSPGSGAGGAVILNGEGLALSDSTLYVADPWWRVVRTVDVRTGRAGIAAGNGSRTAYGDGGPATAAGVALPESVAVGPDGALYIGQDFGGIRVVRNGRISAFAGNGTDVGLTPMPAAKARFGSVTGMSFARNGDLLVREGTLVRRITTSGLVYTVAGSQERGFSGDGGPALLAKLSVGGDVVEAADGALYVADEGNHRVRRVDRTGLISTVAGNGTSTPDYRLTEAGNGGPATKARVQFPDGLAFDRTGRLLIADGAGVRRLTSDGRIQTDRRIETEAVVVGPRGEIYTAARQVATYTGGQRKRVLAGSLALESPDGTPAGQAQLIRPVAVATGPQGVVFGDAITQTLRAVDGNGRIRTRLDFGEELSGLPFDYQDPGRYLTYLSDLAIDRDGTTYLLDDSPDGKLYRSRGKGHTEQLVGRTAAPTSCFGERAGDGGRSINAGLCEPADLAVNGGRVLIADTGAHRIRLIDQHGIIRTVAGSYGSAPGPAPGPDFGAGHSGDGRPAVRARLQDPTAVAWGPAGDFYIADAGNSAVRRVDSRGIIRTVASGLPYDVVDMVVTAKGDIYVLTRYQILKVRGTQKTVVAGTGLAGWSGDQGPATRARLGAASSLALSRDGRTLYVADADTQRVRIVHLPG